MIMSEKTTSVKVYNNQCEIFRLEESEEWNATSNNVHGDLR